MDRTYVVAGDASGIGAATAYHVRQCGRRVIVGQLLDVDGGFACSTQGSRFR